MKRSTSPLCQALLARRMGQYGQRIEAGQVILSGVFIAPINALRVLPLRQISALFANILNEETPCLS